MSLLKVQNLQVSYGPIKALKGIHFHVNEGEVVSLIGANGAGKTTTLRAISGLVPCSGEISFRSQSITHIPSFKKVALGIAQSPEGRGVFADMTVHENLLMGAYSRKDKEVKADIEKYFALFPRLQERAGQLAGTLSGGEQQMLAICRALMSRPSLLLLDEPSLGLAPLIVSKIFQIIKDLHESGMSILLVEQNARMALKVSQRAYVLETGEVTLEGSASDLMSNDDVRKAYLGI